MVRKRRNKALQISQNYIPRTESYKMYGLLVIRKNEIEMIKISP